MSTVTEKKKYNYCYDYPEQRELFKNLVNSDLTLISEKTGLTRQYIGMMSRGERKITPEVQVLVEKIKPLRKELSSIEI